jgi:hypothetical protein
MKTFRIGEVCVIHNQVGAMGHMNGEEVEVIGELTLYQTDHRGYVMAYEVKHPEWSNLFAEPGDLKRKQRGDLDCKASWNQCAWRPNLNPVVLFDGLMTLRARLL